ncbi:MAG TPA: FG-GAP-like repeat-containing protein [Opitutaceae bacterium]|jgi:tetratricopeptide (TPR) repeat protein
MHKRQWLWLAVAGVGAGIGCHRDGLPVAAPVVVPTPQAVDDRAYWRAQEIAAPIGDYPWIAQVTVCDLDGDGLADVLACDCRNQQVIWFRQVRRGKFEPIVIASGIPAPVHVTPVKGGIYHSGHTDLIISAMGEVFPDNDRIGTICILENDGHQHFTPHVIADHIARVTDVEAGDLAGHGQNDLAVGCFGYDQGEILWMENKGNWHFESHSLLDLSGTINVCIADFAGHRVNDIAAVVSQQWEEIYLFQNDGHGNFTPKILWGSTNEDYGSSGISACDLNGDHRPDILYTNGDGFGPAVTAGPRPWHGVQWLENQGEGHFLYHRVADLPGAYSPLGVDLDGSGAMGILVTSAFANGASSDPHNPSLVWYKNDGHMHFTPHVLAIAPKDQVTAAVGDLDGNGKPVIVTGGFYAFPPYDHMGRVSVWRHSDAAFGGSDGTSLAGIPADLQRRTATLEARIAAHPDDVSALGELSRVYDANGLTAEAANCYGRLMTDDPKNPRWWYRDAMIVAGFGRLDDALPLFRRVTELAPDYVPAWVRIGDAELKLDHRREAEAAYNEALKRDPDNVYAWFGQARLDIASGRWQAARDKLERCVRLSDWRIGYDLLPTVYEHLGETSEAAAIRGKAKASGAYQDMVDPWLNELLDDCYDSFRLCTEGGEFYYRGDSATAVRLLQRALRFDPDNPMAHYQLGTYLGVLHRSDEAIREYQRATELQPDLGDPWEAWAVLLRQLGDSNQAMRVVTEGMRHAPQQAGLRLEYGRLLEDQGNLEGAAEQYAQSIRFHAPEEAAPYVALGEVCLKLGRTEDGINWFYRGLKVEPDHPVILSTLTMYEIQTADEPTARSWLQRARAQPRIGAAKISSLESAFTVRFGNSP